MVPSARFPNSRLRKRELIVPTTINNKISIDALIDSGATNSFIDPAVVKDGKLKRRALKRPQPVKNADESDGGQVEFEVLAQIDVEGLQTPMILDELPLPKQKLVLGYDWLSKANPQINWSAGTLSYEEQTPLAMKQWDWEETSTTDH